MSSDHRIVLLEEELTHSVIGSFFEVHRDLGFGFREYVYSRALERVLVEKGHLVEREVAVRIYFRGKFLTRERIDMVVDKKLVVENKAGERLPPDATDQLFGYLCATTFEVGLVLHYGREPRHHRVIFENRFKAHYIRETQRKQAANEPTELPPPLQPR
jgi:GxxExxY protein